MEKISALSMRISEQSELLILHNYLPKLLELLFSNAHKKIPFEMGFLLYLFKLLSIKIQFAYTLKLTTLVVVKFPALVKSIIVTVIARAWIIFRIIGLHYSSFIILCQNYCCLLYLLVLLNVSYPILLAITILVSLFMFTDPIGMIIWLSPSL
jgi:hypothetical protein